MASIAVYVSLSIQEHMDRGFMAEFTEMGP
jgi:hypothetical protein